MYFQRIRLVDNIANIILWAAILEFVHITLYDLEHSGCVLKVQTTLKYLLQMNSSSVSFWLISFFIDHWNVARESHSAILWGLRHAADGWASSYGSFCLEKPNRVCFRKLNNIQGWNDKLLCLHCWWWVRKESHRKSSAFGCFFRTKMKEMLMMRICRFESCVGFWLEWLIIDMKAIGNDSEMLNYTEISEKLNEIFWKPEYCEFCWLNEFLNLTFI